MSRPRVRRYFLWNTFQPRFVTVSCCYQVILIAAIAAALFVPLMLQLDRIPLSSEEAKVVADQFLLLHSRFWARGSGRFDSIGAARHLLLTGSPACCIASGKSSVGVAVPATSLCGLRFARAIICRPRRPVRVTVAALREKIESLEANHAEIKPHLERLKQAAEWGRCVRSSKRPNACVSRSTGSHIPWNRSARRLTPRRTSSTAAAAHRFRLLDFHGDGLMPSETARIYDRRTVDRRGHHRHPGWFAVPAYVGYLDKAWIARCRKSAIERAGGCLRAANETLLDTLAEALCRWYGRSMGNPYEYLNTRRWLSRNGGGNGAGGGNAVEMRGGRGAAVAATRVEMVRAGAGGNGAGGGNGGGGRRRLALALP
ncbi:MAG: hypothetical protein U0231_09050 [Nitrospiraceae bacterium]